MKIVLERIKTWFRHKRNSYHVCRHRLWQGSYKTVAEKLISPHLRDAKSIAWFSYAFCLVSMCLGAGAFERSGAVLVVAGIFLEQKIFKARTALSLVQRGVVSPQGFLHSGHLPGQFLQEWADERVNGVPIFFWMAGQENLMLNLEGKMNWLLINGTVVWGYGSLIHGKIF